MDEVIHLFSQWGYENPWVFGSLLILLVVYGVATTAASTLRGLDWPVPKWLEFMDLFLDKAIEGLVGVITRRKKEKPPADG